ncbi:hypothetical protein RCH09_001894 [Actimicrobium sp. GrIS 1.19]|uniref:DUF5666 domain-containing protein n=1 Tax=Actimicrobium sp. GrIS 1.19 TaxID=3071708 RepID=UPI002DF901BC|nr:hypothetical protein [Actimicrobium sp. GrIS 1.19]
MAMVLGLAAVLVACGGGGGSVASVGSGGTGGAGTPVVSASAGFSGPISGFGSVIVNGVRLDTSSSSLAVTTDDDTPATENDLRLGMIIDVDGSRNDDGVTGAAQTIISHSAVRGPITTIPNFTQFTILGLTVTVKPATVFDGVTGLSALKAGDLIEVHGIPDGADGLIATRIERTGATDVRLAGAVGNLTATTFTLHGTVINYASVTGNSLPTLANGLLVRVKGSLATPFAQVPATINATRVLARNLNNIKKAGKVLELEGIVTSFTSTTVFEVNGNKVSVPAGASVRGTVSAGARVEVDGTLDANGTLIATKVEVKNDDDATQAAQNNDLHGAITSFDLAGKSFTLVVHGVTYTVSFAGADLTKAGTLANGIKVEVTGKVTGTTMVAVNIKLDN